MESRLYINKITIKIINTVNPTQWSFFISYFKFHRIFIHFYNDSLYSVIGLHISKTLPIKSKDYQNSFWSKQGRQKNDRSRITKTVIVVGLSMSEC